MIATVVVMTCDVIEADVMGTAAAQDIGVDLLAGGAIAHGHITGAHEDVFLQALCIFALDEKAR